MESGRIDLEENDSVLISLPLLSVTDQGRFALADPQGAKVRLYEADGSLITQFGRKGEGPGELSTPIQVEVVGDEVWVLELRNGLSRWDQATGEFLNQVATPTPVNFSMLPLSDSTALISGFNPADDPRPLLRVVDIRSGAATEEFFFQEVTMNPPNFPQGVPVARLGMGEVVATETGADSLWYFSVPAGQRVGVVAIPLPEEATIDQTQGDEPPIISELESLSEGRILVQYSLGRGEGQRHGLVLMTREGNLIGHRFPMPRLLDVYEDRMIFADSTGLNPAELTIMEWR